MSVVSSCACLWSRQEGDGSKGLWPAEYLYCKRVARKRKFGRRCAWGMREALLQAGKPGGEGGSRVQGWRAPARVAPAVREDYALLQEAVLAV